MRLPAGRADREAGPERPEQPAASCFHRREPREAPQNSVSGVFLGLGSNLGDREAMLRDAVRRLTRLPETVAHGISSVYETRPVGYAGQGWFLNMVMRLKTRLDPEELLGLTLRVEQEMGRAPSPRFGPRTIDVDILSFEGMNLRSDRLTLPHPRAAERAFVLVPLLELDPEVVLGGVKAAKLLESIVWEEDVRLWRRTPGWLAGISTGSDSPGTGGAPDGLGNAGPGPEAEAGSKQSGGEDGCCGLSGDRRHHGGLAERCEVERHSGGRGSETVRTKFSFGRRDRVYYWVAPAGSFQWVRQALTEEGAPRGRALKVRHLETASLHRLDVYVDDAAPEERFFDLFDQSGGHQVEQLHQVDYELNVIVMSDL